MTTTQNGPTTGARPVGLQLIDGFRLWVDGAIAHTLPSTQRLLALLALRTEPVRRSVVCAELWPDATRMRAGSCLRSTLSRLVRPDYQLVEAVDDALRVAPGVEVDVTVARRMAHGAESAAVASASVASASALAAELPLQVLACELLPEWPDPWLEPERDWFRQLRLRLLEALSERYRHHGDHLNAYRAAMTAVHADPLRESAHRQVIALHLREGNPAAAMRQFTGYRARLRRELGLAPSPEICRLVQPLLRS